MRFIPPMRVLSTVMRRATQGDLTTIEGYEKLAAECMASCREQAAMLGLHMKLVEVYCSLICRQMTVVYTAEERIDFRTLVRTLARRFGGGSKCVKLVSEMKRVGWAGSIPAV